MENEEVEVEVPSWFSDTFDSIGANYVEKDGKVAADTPWGSGYSPTRYADLNVTERDQADKMFKRWDEDDNFTMIEQANGTKTYVDKTSGFSANSDQLMLTAGADGTYEVASMFDIGMFTGAVAEAREELNIQKAMLGLDVDESAGDNKGAEEGNENPQAATNKQTVAAGGKPAEEGNIDINNREVVNNEDGSISTEKSMSVNIDGKEVLIPTIVNGKELDEEEAIAHYERTGEHLGKFDTPEDANKYAQGLHEEQGMKYNNGVAGEMLKTDLSDDTSMVGEAGPKLAAAGDKFVYQGANGKEIELDDKDYNIDGIKAEAPKVQPAVDKYLATNGIKPGDANYQDEYNKAAGQFVEHIVAKNQRATANQPEKPVNNPNRETKSNDTVHWLDRGEKAAKNPKTGKTGYQRRYKNKYSDENNYGNYNNKAEWEKDWSNTLNKYYEGKMGVKQEAMLDDMLQNKELYHNLGIATPAQIKAYQDDRDIYKQAMKSQGTIGGRRMQLKEKQANVRAEVDNQLAVELEDPSKYAIDVVRKLNRNQVKAFYANRDEKNKPTKEQSAELSNLRDRATRIRSMQKLVQSADLEAMEKVSPMDRAGVFIKKYFGGAKDKDLKTVLLNMAKDEMVSRTVKEISGAAASDQERAFIKSWLLGADGASAQQFRSVMNSIQEKVYKRSRKFGERLYMQGKIGALYELSTDTADLKDLPKPKEKIKKVK